MPTSGWCSRPAAVRALSPSGEAASFISARSDDYRAVRARADRGCPVPVIGGGFIGSEITAALVGDGCSVTMVFPGAGIGGRRLSAGAWRWRD